MANAINVKICSWNIKWVCGRDGRVGVDRVAAWLRAADADVVCLQEVAIDHPGLPGMPVGNQAQQFAASLSYPESAYFAGSDLADGSGGRRQFGQLMLSRLPVLQVFRHRLPWPRRSFGAEHAARGAGSGGRRRWASIADHYDSS